MFLLYYASFLFIKNTLQDNYNRHRFIQIFHNKCLIRWDCVIYTEFKCLQYCKLWIIIIFTIIVLGQRKIHDQHWHIKIRISPLLVFELESIGTSFRRIASLLSFFEVLMSEYETILTTLKILETQIRPVLTNKNSNIFSFPGIWTSTHFLNVKIWNYFYDIKKIY